MKQGKSIVDLAKEVQSISDRAKDFVAPGGRLSMVIDESAEAPEAKLKMEGNLPMPVTEHAHKQIAGRVQIPQKYYDRMKTDKPELLADNVNTWLHEDAGKRHMVRTLAEPGTLTGDQQIAVPQFPTAPTVRALLSDRYLRMDNLQLLEGALPAILDNDSGLEIVSTDVTSTRLYIQARFPQVEGEVKVNDPVQAGFIISNSEIGAGALDIRPMIYRLVCTNGMVVGSDADTGRFRRAHLGRAIQGDENFAVYADDTRKADDKALMLKIRDSIQALTDPALFLQLMEEMRQAAEGEKIARPVPAVEALGKAYSLSEPEQESVLEALIRDGDYSRWGALNAVTQVANNHGSYDRAVELESLGGRILGMTETQWNTVARAA